MRRGSRPKLAVDTVADELYLLPALHQQGGELVTVCLRAEGVGLQDGSTRGSQQAD